MSTDLKLHEGVVYESRVIPTMGTQLEAVLVHSDKNLLAGLLNEIEEEVTRLDNKLSHYKVTSDVSRINRAAGVEPVLVDYEMIAILEQAINAYRLTDGAFDVTVGPLLKLWGFFGKNYRVPDDAEINKAKSLVGSDKIRINRARHSVFLEKTGMSLDMGALGKGYALESIANILSEHAGLSAFLSFGGSSIYAKGAPHKSKAWSFNYQAANKPEEKYQEVALKNQGFSVSANYNQSFAQGGQIYGHIFQPQRGQPVEELLSAAAISESPLQAEMLSTALMVLGLEKGKGLLAKEKATQAILTYLEPGSDVLRTEKINFEEV